MQARAGDKAERSGDGVNAKWLIARAQQAQNGDAAQQCGNLANARRLG
jgi:hypothetical protein